MNARYSESYSTFLVDLYPYVGLEVVE